MIIYSYCASALGILVFVFFLFWINLGELYWAPVWQTKKNLLILIYASQSILFPTSFFCELLWIKCEMKYVMHMYHWWEQHLSNVLVLRRRDRQMCASECVLSHAWHELNASISRSIYSYQIYVYVLHEHWKFRSHRKCCMWNLYVNVIQCYMIQILLFLVTLCVLLCVKHTHLFNM